MSLSDVLGRVVTWDEVSEAVRAGFRSRLNLTLIPSPLTPPERERMEQLVIEKYGSEAWTRRL